MVKSVLGPGQDSGYLRSIDGGKTVMGGSQLSGFQMGLSEYMLLNL